MKFQLIVQNWDIAPPPPWYSAGSWVGGYNKTCGTNGAGVPFNNVGNSSYQFPRTGDAYYFLDYINGVGGNNRTYIQIKLVDSLIKGNLYYCEYFFNIPNSLKLACNNIAMLFTKTAVFVDTNANIFGVLPANPQIVNYGNPVLGDTLNWIKVSGVLKATGGEKYLTLGNFKYDNETNTSQIQANGFSKAGYYIDDVSVIPLDSFNLKADAGKDSLINAGDSVFIGSYTNGIDTLKWVNQNTNFAIDSTRPGFWVKPTSNTCYILTQTVNNFTSSDTVCISVRPLPLTFLEFSIFPSLGGVRGGWKTSNEVNVSHFNLQFSENGKDFYTIEKIAAKKQSLNTYEFTYQSHLLGVEGLFRIEAVDKDGKKTYSQTKSLNIKHSSSNITVYPNPAKDFITIQGTDIKEVSILNIFGKIIKQQQLPTATNSLIWKVGEAGIYLIQIKTTNNHVYYQKLIVN